MTGADASSMKWVVPCAVLLLAIAGVVFLFSTRPEAVSRPRPESAPVVRVVEVRLQPHRFIVRGHGSVEPRREGDLVPQVSGLVVWISPALASGGFFEQGEPLLRIDRADYEVALETARAALARAESEFQRAKKELARQAQLAQRSVSSETAFDDAGNRERVAAAALREARAKLEQARRDLARTEVVAPYAGRVRTADVDVGEFVTRGAAIGRIYSVDYAEVDVPIPDAELSYLDLPIRFRDDDDAAASHGAEAAARSDAPEPRVRLRAQFAGKEHVWEGRVVRTGGEIDPKSRMVHVVVQVADPYGRVNAAEGRPPLAVGLFVEAELMGRRVAEASLLPRVALRRDGEVLVVGEDGRMRRRSVEVLRVAGERVVIGAGLAEGEQVVVSPIRAVVDGMAVRTVHEGAEGLGESGPPAGEKAS